MENILKKFDLLIRYSSKSTEKEVVSYLDKVFIEMENHSDKCKRYVGYATVFDTRTNEYYLYYSDKAKEIFDLEKNRFDLIPKNIVTKKNFLSVFRENLSEIVKIIFNRVKITTEKIKIKHDGTATLTNKAMGDLIFNTVEIDHGDYVEDYIVTLENGRIVKGLSPNDVGKEITVSFLSGSIQN